MAGWLSWAAPATCRPGRATSRYSLNLNAYRGQRVQLSFVSSSFPGGLGTGFVLDDVSLIAR